MSEAFSVGLVGARGQTGKELVGLVEGHPSLSLRFAGSRDLAGQQVPGSSLAFEAMGPEEVAASGVDAVFLALPDGAGDPYVTALDGVAPETTIVDISADHRFDETWAYGLPELFRDDIVGARRVANPGCYATAMELAIAPLLGLLAGTPVAFGVSGYSGAGSTPGPRNDPERLADNLLPYKLVGHTHEREATRHLGVAVRFMPHVHPTFRGLLVTVHAPLADPTTAEDLRALFEARYHDDPLIEVQPEPPELRDGTGRIGALIGGFGVGGEGTDAVVVAAEDNLLKGAAVQAVQNLNLALGLPELAGIQAP